MLPFYESLHQEIGRCRPRVDGLDSTSKRESEIRELWKEWILQVVRDLQGEKAPGPYGFTMAFFFQIVVVGDQGGCIGIL